MGKRPTRSSSSQFQYIEDECKVAGGDNEEEEDEAKEAGGNDEEEEDAINAERLAQDTTVIKTRRGVYQRFKKALRTVVATFPDFIAEQEDGIATENAINAIRSNRSLTIIAHCGDKVELLRKVAEDSQSFDDVFKVVNDLKGLKGFSNDSQPM